MSECKAAEVATSLSELLGKEGVKNSPSAEFLQSVIAEFKSLAAANNSKQPPNVKGKTNERQNLLDRLTSLPMSEGLSRDGYYHAEDFLHEVEHVLESGDYPIDVLKEHFLDDPNGKEEELWEVIDSGAYEYRDLGPEYFKELYKSPEEQQVKNKKEETVNKIGKALPKDSEGLASYYNTKEYKEFTSAIAVMVENGYVGGLTVKKEVSKAKLYVERVLGLGGKDATIAAYRKSSDTIFLPDFNGMLANKGILEKLSKASGKTHQELEAAVDGIRAENNPYLVTLHEYIHAGSKKFMDSNPNDSKTVYVRNLAKKLMKNAETDKVLAGIQGGYWMKGLQEGNLDTFIAVSLSNVDMMNYLNTMKSGKDTTVLSKLLKTLAGMVGINLDSEGAALLDAFMGMAEGKVDSNTSNLNTNTKPAEESTKVFEAKPKTTEPVEISNEVHDIVPGVPATKGQNRAINSIAAWMKGNGKSYLLAGRGGTGKTSVISKVLKVSGLKSKDVVFVTPSHAATEVLKDSNEGSKFGTKDRYGTIAALLGKKPLTDEKGKIIYDSSGNPKFGVEMTDETSSFQDMAAGAKVLVIDEASMVSKEDYDSILATYGSQKLVFMGDIAQLPPIGDKDIPGSVVPESPVFMAHQVEDVDFNELTEVKRQQETSTITKVNDYVYTLTRKLIDDRRSKGLDTSLPLKGEYFTENERNLDVKVVERVGKKIQVLNMPKVIRDIKSLVKNSSTTDTYMVKPGVDLWKELAESFIENGNNVKGLMYNQSKNVNNQTITNATRNAYFDVKGKEVVPGFMVDDLIVFEDKEFMWDEDTGGLDVRNGVIYASGKYAKAPNGIVPEVIKTNSGVVVDVGKPMPMVVEAIKNGDPITVKPAKKYSIITIKMDDGRVLKAPMPADSSPGKVREWNGKYGTGAYIKNFGYVKSASPNMAFGYWNNVHKAQGSTYKEAYVNLSNIASMYDYTTKQGGEEASYSGESFMKALYVAISRPREKLVLVADENIKPGLNTVSSVICG